MFRYNLRSQSGFSLIQVLMAVALTSIISLILAQILLNMTTMQQRARVEGEMMDRMEDMRRALIRSDACIISLNSSGQDLRIKKPTSFPLALDRLVDENNKVLFRVGDTMAGGSLQITEIVGKLNDTTPVWKQSDLIIMDMMVIAKLINVPFGVDTFRKRFTLTIETGPVGEIVTCNSLNYADKITLENAICAAFGGALPPGAKLCDLTKSSTVLQAACETMGLQLKGDHCE